MKKPLTFTDVVTGRPVTYPDMTEIAPGVYAGGIPPESIPPVGFHSWHKLPDNTYLPVVRTFQARLRLTTDIGRQLGVGIPDNEDTRAVYETVRRLVQAGFIKAGQLGPGSVELDLQSFWHHYRATREPGFWTKERRRKYRRINRGGGGAVLPKAENEE